MLNLNEENGTFFSWNWNRKIERMHWSIKEGLMVFAPLIFKPLSHPLSLLLSLSLSYYNSFSYYHFSIAPSLLYLSFHFSLSTSLSTTLSLYFISLFLSFPPFLSIHLRFSPSLSSLSLFLSHKFCTKNFFWKLCNGLFSCEVSEIFVLVVRVKPRGEKVHQTEKKFNFRRM